MSTAEELLERARQAGITLYVRAGTVRVRPPSLVTRAMHAELMPHLGELLALLTTPAPAAGGEPLTAEVTWRLAILAPAVPSRGPIILPTVRPHPGLSGTCGLCGDPLGAERRGRALLRCPPCSEAARLAVYRVREGCSE